MKEEALALPMRSGRPLYQARTCVFFRLCVRCSQLCAALLVCGLFAACGRDRNAKLSPSLAQPSRAYLRLVVALGERDPDSLDYYYGPEQWVSDVRKDPPTLPQIRQSSLMLIQALEEHPPAAPEDQARSQFLMQQLRAVVSRVDLLLGAHPSFDEETKEFFGLRVPLQTDQDHLARIRAELDELLPGRGNLAQRYAAFDSEFVVAPSLLPAVMNRAIEGCRAQTLAHIPMPPGEHVTVEYVANQPWSGFSRYLGNFHSLVRINTDFPLTVDRVLQLACHEAYPGHHTYNSLRDLQLVRARDLPEFMAQPTFSPQSLASEAAATFAVEVAFPGQERAAFERDLLFPLAGLDPHKAERYFRIEQLVDELHTAVPPIARAYLDGKLEFIRAGSALETQALMAHSDATLKYINEYRSYMTTYTYGRDLVESEVDGKPGSSESNDLRWQRYLQIMTSVAPLQGGSREILTGSVSRPTSIGKQAVAIAMAGRSQNAF
jgi:hypothetical protein